MQTPPPFPQYDFNFQKPELLTVGRRHWLFAVDSFRIKYIALEGLLQAPAVKLFAF